MVDDLQLVPLRTTRAIQAGTDTALNQGVTTHSADAIGTLIDSVSPIVSMERDGLVVIALGSSADADVPAYLTLAEAAEGKGVDVH